jgi:threonine dehydrogenase-like Zn-dependent dehydrogenase
MDLSRLLRLQSRRNSRLFSAGPVGLLCAYSALFRGAARVYVVDHIKARLAKAKEIRAISIDFTRGNAATQILKLEKLGVDHSCGCLGEECVNTELKPQQNAVINDMVSVTIAGGGMGQVDVYFAQTPAPGRPDALTRARYHPRSSFPRRRFGPKTCPLKQDSLIFRR